MSGPKHCSKFDLGNVHFCRSIYTIAIYIFEIQYYTPYISESKPMVDSTTDARPENIQKLDVSIDPTKTEERQRLTNESIRRYDKEFGSLDMEKSYMAMFELLWYSQMPCFDVKNLTSQAKDEMSFLKKCFWKDNPISCNAIFTQRPTDQGMCCSFNMAKANQILKESKYTQAISARQSEDAEFAFETKDPPGWYTENKEPIPQAGRNKGLMLIIDGHANKVSDGTVKENVNGFIALVDDDDKFPLLSLTSLIARPGYENNIKVDAIHLETKKETRKYEPNRRNCYFPDEHKLKAHRRYSQFNCIFECEEEFASKCLTTCNEAGQECDCQDIAYINRISLADHDSCVPWFFPAAAKRLQKMCNPWNAQKFLTIIQKQIPEDQCNHCLPDCTTTKYETSMTYARLRMCDRTNLGGTSMLCALVDGSFNPAPWMATAQEEFEDANQTIPWYLDTNYATISSDDDIAVFPNERSKIDDAQRNSTLIFSSELKGGQTYDAFKKDIGIINIFFSEKKILKYVTSNRMSELDFLSQIGGSLGLSMGISLISIIEIIYWLTFRFFRNG